MKRAIRTSISWAAASAVVVAVVAGCARGGPPPVTPGDVVLPEAPARGESVSADWSRIAPPDVAYLEGGDEYTGRLDAIDLLGVVFRPEGEDPVRWDRSEIQRLTVGRARRFAGVETIDEIHDARLRALWAESPGEEDWPDAGYVVLGAEKSWRLLKDGGSERIERRTVKILKDRGKSAANVVITYLKGEEHPEVLYAVTIDPDGAIHHLSDAAISDSSAYSGIPEYDRARRFKFAMPQVEKGTVIEYAVTVRREVHDPLHPFAGIEIFRGGEPVLSRTVRVEVPRGTTLQRQERNFDGGSFERVRLADHEVYTWKMDEQRAIISEPMMPPALDIAPAVAFAAGEDWRDVGAACAAAVDAASGAGEEIAVAAREWSEGLTGIGAARAIYRRVAREIRDAPVPPSDYQYAPKPADEILAKGIANPIDKPFLLCRLLTAAGFDARMAWLRPRAAGELFDDIPAISQFSAAVVVLDLGRGDRHYLAPMSDRIPFGTLPSGYQDAWILAGDRGEISRIPASEPSEEGRSIAYDMAIGEDGSVEITKWAVLRGQSAISFRTLKESRDEEIRRSFQGSVARVDPRAELLSWEMSDLENLDAPVWFELRYRIEDYALRSGDRMMAMRIPELDYGATVVAKPDREFDLDWATRLQTRTTIKVRLPDGFAVYHLPEPAEYDAGWVEFDSEFDVEEGVVAYEDRYERRSVREPARSYKRLRECLQSRARMSREYLVLERPAESGGELR